jgi:hypothetical protein
MREAHVRQQVVRDAPQVVVVDTCTRLDPKRFLLGADCRPPGGHAHFEVAVVEEGVAPMAVCMQRALSRSAARTSSTLVPSSAECLCLNTVLAVFDKALASWSIRCPAKKYVTRFERGLAVDGVPRRAALLMALLCLACGTSSKQRRALRARLRARHGGDRRAAAEEAVGAAWRQLPDCHSAEAEALLSAAGGDVEAAFRALLCDVAATYTQPTLDVLAARFVDAACACL